MGITLNISKRLDDTMIFTFICTYSRLRQI